MHATLVTIAIKAEVDYIEDYGSYLEGKTGPEDIIAGGSRAQHLLFPRQAA